MYVLQMFNARFMFFVYSLRYLFNIRNLNSSQGTALAEEVNFDGLTQISIAT